MVTARTVALCTSVGDETLTWLAEADFGDVPTWLQVVATAAALLAAFRAAGYTKGLLERESDRDRRAEEREVRAQAERVSAWLVRRAKRLPTGGSYQPVVGWELRLSLLNSSRQPVYDVESSFTTGGKCVTQTDRLDILPPESEPVVRRLPEGAADELEALVDESGEDDPSVPRVEVSFTDAAGRRWIRDRHGRLGRVGPSAHDSSAVGVTDEPAVEKFAEPPDPS